jgi:hypothetical protein
MNARCNNPTGEYQGRSEDAAKVGFFITSLKADEPRSV